MADRESTMGVATIWRLYGFINFINLDGWLSNCARIIMAIEKEELKLT